ncbi:hypothetical protein BKI52_00505 [marine bacterium AO1-C]|nr:hypothetical protein BKI52_00505 [marine bacterium AO1-C]
MGFLNKKRVSRSILYFLAEIIIVVAGIFIAILLNNWNEDRKKSADSEQSLKRIASDLKTEKLVFEQFKNQLKRSRKYLKGILYEGKEDHLDSIYVHISHAFRHYKMNAEYINLKYSGRLGLIPNNVLRYNIVNYYEVYYSVYQEMSEGHKKFVNEDLHEYFQNEFPSDTTYLVDAELVKQKLKDPKLVNLIKDQITAYGSINQSVQTSIIDTLVNRIKREY